MPLHDHAFSRHLQRHSRGPRARAVLWRLHTHNRPSASHTHSFYEMHELEDWPQIQAVRNQVTRECGAKVGCACMTVEGVPRSQTRLAASTDHPQRHTHTHTQLQYSHTQITPNPTQALREAGDLAKQFGHRLTLHPSECVDWSFCQLLLANNASYYFSPTQLLLPTQLPLARYSHATCCCELRVASHTYFTHSIAHILHTQTTHKPHTLQASTARSHLTSGQSE